jgi:hypothetical protein
MKCDLVLTHIHNSSICAIAQYVSEVIQREVRELKYSNLRIYAAEPFITPNYKVHTWIWTTVDINIEPTLHQTDTPYQRHLNLDMAKFSLQLLMTRY